MPNGPKILVVDDECTVRDFLRSLLEMEGYQISTAANGMEALEKIKKENFKAVILDIVLPDINGLSLFYKIRKLEPSLAGRVIFVTGTGLGVQGNKGLSGLGAAYFHKPIEAESLMESLIFTLSKKTTRPGK